MDECASGNGNICSGETCCASETMCSTDPTICLAMFCESNPEVVICQ
jgi:hypothetical protein